jgi:lipopolysaccharide/colanic/teichoic acid biosynthesis glycosyltransferase
LNWLIQKKMNFLKRSFDLFFSIIFIVITLPIFFIIYLIYLIFYDGDCIYASKRIGYNLNEFKIFKFRTMIKNAENLGSQVSSLNDKRILLIGRFLRATKIDELPQLYNILLGEMSFVGPRPNFKKLVDKYPVKIKNILAKLKPGLTDFSTLIFSDLDDYLRGKNFEIKYFKKVEPIKLFLIKKYFEKKTFFVDLKILFFTVLIILKIFKFNKKKLKLHFNV